MTTSLSGQTGGIVVKGLVKFETAWGARHVCKRFGSGKFGDIARKMPYFSSALMGLVGLLMGVQALIQLTAS